MAAGMTWMWDLSATLGWAQGGTPGSWLSRRTPGPWEVRHSRPPACRVSKNIMPRPSLGHGAASRHLADLPHARALECAPCYLCCLPPVAVPPQHRHSRHLWLCCIQKAQAPTRPHVFCWVHGPCCYCAVAGPYKML